MLFNQHNLPGAQPGTAIPFVQGMLYPALVDPTLFMIPVLPVGHTHYPLIEATMQDSEMPGCVHDVVVEVWHRDIAGGLERSRFRCFFRPHKKLPMQADSQEKTFPGDLVVMRAASKHHTTNVDHIRAFDRDLIDFVVQT
ncbi:hypothetical protein K438DRAFT_1759808 [Mycena galopus ATCC 62051]|nr:hypothetical protein K438DRAFT_1759808 [Mycena galopus ATCC 62051]